MIVAAAEFGPDSSLVRLRGLRRTQAWTLAGFAVVSIVVGVALLVGRIDGWTAFLNAVGWQFVIWGPIDLVFAAMGIAQSIGADRRVPCPQAEADEFLAAEKLARSLRFNHKLNIGYLLVAALLLAWAGGANHAGLAGHGVGVLIQGGFLFLFDLAMLKRLDRLMAAPV